MDDTEDALPTLDDIGDVERVLELGRNEGAVALLRRVQMEASADPARLHLIAYGFQLLDRFDEAAQILGAAAELTPDDWLGWCLLADSLMMCGRAADALEVYRRAIDTGCNDPNALEDVRRSLLEWGSSERTIQVLTDTCDRLPNLASVHESIGLTHAESGNHRAAVTAFRRALEIDPLEPRHRYNLVEALSRSGQLSEAWRVFWQDPDEGRTGPGKVDLYEEPIALSWEEAGGEFVRRLQCHAEGRIPLLSASYGLRDPSNHCGEFFVDLTSAALRSRLVIRPGEAGVRLIVAAIDGTPVQALDLSLWRSMVEKGLNSLGGRREVPWFAVIGTDLMSNFEASDQQLRRSARLQHFRLRPCVRLQEQSGVPALANECIRQFSPILVEGLCRGWHDWGIHAHEEGFQLRRLCALLSLAWNGCWTIKLYPQAGDVRATNIQPLETAEPVADTNLMKAVDGVEIENWMGPAWLRIEQNQLLTDALITFHEGMLLFRRHPSMAMLAFITCCETMGRQLMPSAGSGEKVRAAFRSVLEEDEAMELWQAYSRRNETAHEGKLHGFEIAFGLERHDLLGSGDPGLHFTLGLLRRIRGVSRDIILRALTD